MQLAFLLFFFPKPFPSGTFFTPLGLSSTQDDKGDKVGHTTNYFNDPFSLREREESGIK